MNSTMGLAVFLTDAAITFFGWQRLDSWMIDRKVWTIVWDAALTVAIGVNTMGYVTAGWPMLGASVLGSALGTLLSFKWKVL